MKALAALMLTNFMEHAKCSLDNWSTPPSKAHLSGGMLSAKPSAKTVDSNCASPKTVWAICLSSRTTPRQSK